ncbi:ABC transporter substrate-binding protein [Microbacterium invictum]|uniref:Branched-chain amino acid transport system substrate-binding protein/urea transport system substrate-binding protein n=1 Tax=Microbacterium invictum TaxID=515415 RepID=A0AA40VLQ9_9MICO|nr:MULTISPECIES: ABC transporter substrate-binding protein [Microbacterium]MBB4138528.1 branched-chain amino acid transport system substrate-binding protein/urea transport system substrate-binding protein [Microbacterium invictum]
MEAVSTARRLNWRRTTTGAAALAVATLVLSACGGGSFAGDAGDGADGAQDRAFRLGLVAPTTGVASLEGNSLVMGVELGIEAVNADGGVLGHPIELVVVDDKSDAATSTQVTQQLIRQNDVDYVLGTIAGDTSVAAGSVAAEAGVPFSSVVNGTVEFCSAHFWPFGASERMMVEDLIPHMIEQYGSRVGLVGNDYIFPHTYHAVASEIITENGGEVVAEEYSPLGTADWQPVIGKLSNADPDWILTAVVGGDAVSFMTQADQFGLLTDRGVTGTTSQQEFYAALGPILEGRTTALQYSDQTPGADNEAFVAAYRAEHGDNGSISAIAATSYEAVRFIAAAVNAAGGYDAEAISEQMSTIRLDGLLGDLGFREDNHYVSSDMVLVQIDEGGVYSTVKVLDPIDDTTARNCS